MKKAVMYGGGNIGRGFIGATLSTLDPFFTFATVYAASSGTLDVSTNTFIPFGLYVTSFAVIVASSANKGFTIAVTFTVAYEPDFDSNVT